MSVRKAVGYIPELSKACRRKYINLFPLWVRNFNAAAVHYMQRFLPDFPLAGKTPSGDLCFFPEGM
jgi:hypothetical protein